MSRCVTVLVLMLAPTFARASTDACAVVQASLDKLAATPAVHQWFTKTDSPPWQRVTIKDTMYMMVEENGVWTAMPAEADQTLAAISRACSRRRRAFA